MSQNLWHVVFQNFLFSMEIFLVCFSNPNHNHNRHTVAACDHVTTNEKQMRVISSSMQVYEIVWFGLSTLKTQSHFGKLCQIVST